MDIPKITFKNHRDGGMIYVISWHGLDYQSPWGNLQLKMMVIATKIRYLNEEKIPLTFNQYLHEKKCFAEEKTVEYVKHRFYLEEIVSHVKNISDELISILSIAKYFHSHNSQWPKQPPIDSIGSLLSNPLKGFQTDYDYLECLNDIANAKKHWLHDSDFSNLFGRDEPVIYALGKKMNNTDQQEIQRGVSLKYLIDGFSKFMNDYQHYRGYSANA